MFSVIAISGAGAAKACGSILILLHSHERRCLGLGGKARKNGVIRLEALERLLRSTGLSIGLLIVGLVHKEIDVLVVSVLGCLGRNRSLQLGQHAVVHHSIDVDLVQVLVKLRLGYVLIGAHRLGLFFAINVRSTISVEHHHGLLLSLTEIVRCLLIKIARQLGHSTFLILLALLLIDEDALV